MTFELYVLLSFFHGKQKQEEEQWVRAIALKSKKKQKYSEIHWRTDSKKSSKLNAVSVCVFLPTKEKNRLPSTWLLSLSFFVWIQRKKFNSGSSVSFTFNSKAVFCLESIDEHCAWFSGAVKIQWISTKMAHEIDYQNIYMRKSSWICMCLRSNNVTTLEKRANMPDTGTNVSE